ncbi:hypothetical protein C8J57DRAFT_1367927 [Mycena rebaudengoi]|nr:hypothetical protein C8J57DRAFT_1367927 [Mycena rebaudengoi]
MTQLPFKRRIPPRRWRTIMRHTPWMCYWPWRTSSMTRRRVKRSTSLQLLLGPNSTFSFRRRTPRTRSYGRRMHRYRRLIHSSQRKDSTRTRRPRASPRIRPSTHRPRRPPRCRRTTPRTRSSPTSRLPVSATTRCSAPSATATSRCRSCAPRSALRLQRPRRLQKSCTRPSPTSRSTRRHSSTPR